MLLVICGERKRTGLKPERNSRSDLRIGDVREERAARAKRGSSERQAAKGDALRTQVLDAAIDCLAEFPYSEVSASVIARRAGVSRGGMQYYFPTRLELLRQTVAHLHRVRLDIFRTDLSALREGADAVDHVIDSHWRHLNEREFLAYQELVLAGRSEPELADLLASSYRAFLDEWHDIARDTIGWHAEDPEVARMGNIAHYLLEGMAYGQLGGQLRKEEVSDLLSYAKSIMRSAMTRDD